MELTIGMVCACMPSAYSLYKRFKNRQSERALAANRPRTGRSRRNFIPTITAKATGRNVASIADAHPAPGMAQMQSSHSLAATFLTHAPAGSDSLGPIHLTHVNSHDGRAEGWLATKPEGEDTTDLEAATGPSSCAMKLPRQWSTIWDGTQGDGPA